MHHITIRLINVMKLTLVVIAYKDESFFRETDEVFEGSLNAKNFGVMGDGNSDDTRSIQSFLDIASKLQKGAFFPAGEYMISANILAKEYTKIYGSAKGITAFRAVPSKILTVYIGNATPPQKFAVYSNLSITNIFFDGLKIDYKDRFYKSNMLVSNCVFFVSTHLECPVSPLTQFLSWHRIKDGLIQDVVLLRSRTTYGVGCGLFKTHGVIIRDNIFGLDVSNLDWLTKQYRGLSTWNQLPEKLQFIKNYYNMDSDQGQFRASIYGNHDDKILIEGNIFNGSPYAEQLRDHVIYMKGFDDAKVLGNYARGWPRNPSGGLKMRNGENLVVARNFLVDTGVLLYTHNETSSYEYLHPGLSNVLIYGNHLIENYDVGAWGTGISYFEPHNFGQDRNIVISGNVFEIAGFDEKSRPSGIQITNGNPGEHHVFRDNVYFGTSVPVRFGAFGDNPVYFENGELSFDLVSSYMNVPIPNLIIPVYERPPHYMRFRSNRTRRRWCA